MKRFFLALCIIASVLMFAMPVMASDEPSTSTQLSSPEVTLSPKVQKDFQDYITKKEATKHVSKYIPTYNEIQTFVDNEASTGAIENTSVAKVNVTKSLVRISMAIVVEGGYAKEYNLAAYCLNHSLQDSPSSQAYANGTWQSNIVKNGSWYQNLMKSLQSTLHNYSSTHYFSSGSATLNSPTDLFFALNKVSYLVAATKSNGKWTAYITVNDTYNFEYTNWKNYAGLKGDAATALNTYGVIAQSIGAVVPYSIAVYATQSNIS